MDQALSENLVGGADGATTAQARLWATLSHASFLVLGIIGPLAILLTKGKGSPFVRDQAVEALNFQLTGLVALIVAAVLVMVTGDVVVVAVYLVGAVLSILGAAAGHRGERYRYPVVLRIVD